MRRLYTLLVWLALPVVSLLVLWRGFRERDYWRGWRQRLGLDYAHPTGFADRGVWLHAVSMGEVQAAGPLAAALHAAGRQLLVTSATPTGRRRAEQTLGSVAAVRYAPYDLPGAIARVLRATRPGLLIVLETELWPNLLHGCAAAGVPVLLASARLSPRTLAGLARWPGLLSGPALANLQVAAQTEGDAQRFRELGVPPAHVQVCGNLKFDFAAPAGFRARGQALRQALAPQRPMWVAGSTHAGEETAALLAHAGLQARGSALLVLAPRHPRRFDEVAELLRESGRRMQRRSAREPLDAATDVLLLDTMGELADFYAAADVAYVGGSLVPVGGHNLLEPAALGVPVMTGPLHTTAPEIYAALLRAGAVQVVGDAAAMAAALLQLYDVPAERLRLAAAATAVLQANRGSLQQVVNWAEALARSERA